jgi:uncharacterized protein YukE
MSLFPDPAILLALADRIAGHAAAARARASDLGSAIATADWHGAAADAFAIAGQAILLGLRGAGNRLDDAADTLRRSAAVVRVLLDDLERLGGDVLDLGGEIVRTVEDGLIRPDRLCGDGRSLLDDGVGLVDDVGGLVGDVGGLLGLS